MKGEIAIETGEYGGKFFVAAFVLGLDTPMEAAQMIPIVREAVATSAKTQLRHGLHVVESPDDQPPAA